MPPRSHGWLSLHDPPTRTKHNSPLGVWSTPATAPTDSLLATPAVLLAYRAAAFAFTAGVGAAQLARLGPRALCYYTVWSWALLTAAFGLGAALSARRVLRGRVGAWSDGSIDVQGAAFIALLHVALPAALIVVALTWAVLVPMLLASPDPAVRAHTRLMFFNFTSYAQHGANAGLALGELALNAVPAHPYLMGLLGAYSSLYGIWAFAFFRVTGRWLYPFLNAHRPWAFAAYAGLYAAHWGFFGLAVLAWRGRDALARRMGRCVGVLVDVDGAGNGAVVEEVEEEGEGVEVGDKKED
jgi:hypothetical protein